MLMCLSYANSALTALQARPRIQRKASGFWNLLIFPSSAIQPDQLGREEGKCLLSGENKEKAQ